MSQLKNAFGLIIGVGNDLPASARDAQAIYDIFSDDQIAGYDPDNITLLVEKEATHTNIIVALDELVKKVDYDSSVFIFYSGHGGTYTDNDIIELEEPEGTPLKPEEENRSHYYLVPNNFDTDNYRDTWVHATLLKEKINQLKSRRLIFFLDCCHAEGMTKAGPELTMKSGSLKDRLQNPEGLVHKIDDGKGFSIVSSCRAEEVSWILGDEPNSLFTTCLIEVLKGKHKTVFPEPFIRMTEVVQYIMKRVPEKKPEQRPFVNLQLYDDFVLSCVPQSLIRQVQQAEQVSGGVEKELKPEVVTKFREEGAANLVVFVHGFSGEAAGTFGKIPGMLIEEESLKGWDLVPLGYSQYTEADMGKTVWASEEDIDNIADYLRSVIESKYDNYRRIALVGHSLGGLVVQKALTLVDEKDLSRISHVMLFASPSGGIEPEALKLLCDADNAAVTQKGEFIQQLRKVWDQQFSDGYPFALKVVAATNDPYVPVESSLKPFGEDHRFTFDGDHYSLVQPEDERNDSYNLILQSLTGNEFYSQFSNREEVNLALGEYDAVIKELLPKKDKLKLKGLRNLIFALEGMDREADATEILQTHPLAKDNSDLMGILGGRFKRRYLLHLEEEDAENAIEYYEKGLEIAREKDNAGQIYYHAINLAFLNLLSEEDEDEMRRYAGMALEAAERDPFENLWKVATLAEANLYLGKLDESRELYEKAAAMAGIREKISIHTNAYAAYTSLMHTENQEDPFIKFLKSSFLS